MAATAPAPATVTHRTRESIATLQTPVKLHPSAHLDSGAYIKGNHAVVIHAEVLIHPRARIYAEHGTITIGPGSIISERCLLGVLPDGVSSESLGERKKETGQAQTPLSGNSSTSTEDGYDVKIGQTCYIHPHTTISPSAVIQDSCIIEAGCIIMPHSIIGAHSKICAGITIPSSVVIPPWTVVYGSNGCSRRTRSNSSQAHIERNRLDIMRIERAGLIAVLKASTIKVNTAATAQSRRNRDSVSTAGHLRGESVREVKKPG